MYNLDYHFISPCLECCSSNLSNVSVLFSDVFYVVAVQMQAGDPVVDTSMAVAGAQSRSEDEESLGVKDVKRTATQAFGSGVPKRRSSNRFELCSCMLHFSFSDLEKSTCCQH